MAAVSDKVLNWLYSVLTNDYHDANRTYSDVAQALAQYPTLSPRTEVYTYENGTSALLLLISGTIPVTFRGVVYRFPVALWVPHAYPRQSPMIYVTPSQDMVIRAGQHVSGEGRVYHPYLAQWDRYWDKSTILDFLAVLRGVFAKEPPVISKQQAQYGPAKPAEATPPPVPPPPEEWRRSIRGSPAPSSGTLPNQGPPPPPPKPGQQAPGQQVSSRPQVQVGYQNAGPAPPPVPPHPSRGSGSYEPSGGREHTPEALPRPQQQRPSDWQKPIPPLHPQVIPHSVPRPTEASQYSDPVSPITPDDRQSMPFSYHQPQYSAPQPQQSYPVREPNSYRPSQSQPFPPPQVSNQYPPQPGYAAPAATQPAHPLNPQPPKPKQPIPDILDSPLEVTIPSQTGSLPSIPAPPIPPNPEKDALLKALSSTLIAQLNQTVISNQSALQPLQAQQNALRQAHTRLQSELDQLQQLDAALASNEAILLNSMREADRVIEESKTRKVPDVDEVLVAPTVVGNQLYMLCAEERAVGEAMFVLGRGLDGGRVGFDVFVKQTRSLAREQFLKKALIKKIARGMGLDEYDYNRPG